MTNKAVKVFTCVFVLNEQNDKILLGFKKRGLLVHKWNGFGGKVEPGETILEAAERELVEECGLRPYTLNDNGILTVDMENEAHVAQVHLFTTNEYFGEIAESDEMLPRWFDVNAIPFEQMCYDHRLWLPEIIKNKKLNAFFKYDRNGAVLEEDIREIKSSSQSTTR